MNAVDNLPNRRLPSMTQRDGNWYAMTPGQHVTSRLVYRNWTRRVVWHGRVQRFDVETKKWATDKCPHDHNKRGAALKCAEAAAKRLNKEAQS